MTESLCVMLLGQLRSFFRGGQQQFDNVIETSLKHYTKIHVIFGISGSCDVTLFNNYIHTLHAKNISTQVFIYDSGVANGINQQRFQLSKYIDILTEHLHQNNNCKHEVPDPTQYIANQTYQFHQLEIAIDKMVLFEQQEGIKFDTVMKTRFDVGYYDGFYPKIPESDSLESLLLIDDHIKNLFKHNGFDVTSESYFNLLKENDICLPQYVVKEHMTHFTLGGKYLSNYHILKDIRPNNALYMLNDHVIFGIRETFVKLKDMFREYALIKTDKHIYHYYAAEAQLLIFCFEHNICPVMYLHDNIHTIIR